MKDIYGILGVVFLMGSAVPYIIACWTRTAKPHAFSWILWSLINAIVFAAQITEHAGAGAWTTLVTTLINFGISIYALKFGESHFTRGDWICFLSALAALPLWIATKDPLWSVILVSVIDTVGFFPTLRKSWNKPHQEVLMTFVFSFVGFSFSIAALQNYDLVNWLYPAVVLVTNVLFVSTLSYRRYLIPAT